MKYRDDDYAGTYDEVQPLYLDEDDLPPHTPAPNLSTFLLALAGLSLAAGVALGTLL